eukprot:547919-Prymnesium_polylepis.1
MRARCDERLALTRSRPRQQCVCGYVGLRLAARSLAVLAAARVRTLPTTPPRNRLGFGGVLGPAAVRARVPSP